MARCLLGVLVVTAGLVVLASASRGNLPLHPQPARTGGTRLRDMETIALSGAPRTLLRPLPALDIRFSLN
jgi:hypothetical protein